MSGLEQCETCGAVLLPEDTFCGECGTPRSEAQSSVPPEVAAPEAAPDAAAPEAPRQAVPATRRTAGWRTAFISLMVVGVLVCILGIVAFVLAGATETEGWTVEENWLFSAGCCLLPIAGSGLVLMLAGAGIWFTRLRKP